MPRIEEMFAFVVEDKGPDDEGIVGMILPGSVAPMVGTDMARVESLKPIARNIAKQLGKQIKLIRFSVREELETIE